MDLSLVIPLYNETQRLGLMEEGLRAFSAANGKYSYEIVLVNDGSTDDTGARLKECRERLLRLEGRKPENVRILDLAPNRGKGGALRAGVEKAQGNWVLTLDADMATGPAELLEWEKYDERLDLSSAPAAPCVYVGDREHPDARVTDFVHRRIIGRLFNALVQLMSGIERDDTQCGFKLYSREAASTVFSRLRDTGWAHDVEILLHLEREGVQVNEMPVSWRAVEAGSIRPLFDGPRMLLSVMKTCFRQCALRPRKPGWAWDAGAWALLGLLLVRVLLTFKAYGVAWDEEFSLVYGNHVLRFFATMGRDDGALTYRNLRFYGGLFDAGANWIAHRLPFAICDSRHLVIGLAGLFGLAGAWRLARLLGGPAAGLFALALLSVEPSWAGHMLINAKDIPFAAGYIWGLYYLVRCIGRFPNIPNGLVVKTGLAMGLALSIRVGGALLPAYLALAGVLYLSRANAFSRHPADRPVRRVVPLVKSIAGIYIIAYAVMLAFWPYVLVNPLTGPLSVLREISSFSGWAGPVLLGGAEYHSSNLPLRYLPEYFLVKLPEIVLAGLGAGVLLAVFRRRRRAELDSAVAAESQAAGPIVTCRLFFVLFALLFPLIYAMATRVVTYDAHRHFLFLVPVICVLAGLAYERLYRLTVRTGRAATAVLVLVAVLLAGDVVAALIRLYPYEYVYYNRITGGAAGAAGRYELEYWGTSYREAVKELVAYVDETEPGRVRTAVYSVTVFGPRESARPFLPENFRLSASVRESDFYISFTRFRGHEVVHGKTIASISRGGAELAVVKDLRSVPPEKRLPDWWNSMPEDGSAEEFVTPAE